MRLILEGDKDSVRLYQEGEADYEGCLDLIENALQRLTEEGGAWIEPGLDVERLGATVAMLAIHGRGLEETKEKAGVKSVHHIGELLCISLAPVIDDVNKHAYLVADDFNNQLRERMAKKGRKKGKKR